MKMSKFTASNGIQVRVLGRDRVELHTERNRLGTDMAYDHLNMQDMQALREFFLHERDQELGRWRWPENPNWVAYFNEEEDTVTVLDETEPDEGGFTYHRRSHFLDYPHATPAAKAYFEAHPEQKPWHDAKPGEAWVISYGGDEHAVISDGAYFLWQEGSEQDITDSRITGGRRIWPEGETNA